MEHFEIYIAENNDNCGIGSLFQCVKPFDYSLDSKHKFVINKNSNVKSSNENYHAKHLYFISNDTIKVGDVIIDTLDSNSNPFMVHANINRYNNNTRYKKILASTNIDSGYNIAKIDKLTLEYVVDVLNENMIDGNILFSKVYKCIKTFQLDNTIYLNIK